MKYGYVRVSTAQQHIDRQIDALLELGLEKSCIYIDYESGKDFNRRNYKKLIRKLKKDDLVIIKSIDRLGRDYNMIIDEWRLITKEKEADIMVIDMPLLDTRIVSLSFCATNDNTCKTISLINLPTRFLPSIRVSRSGISITMISASFSFVINLHSSIIIL